MYKREATWTGTILSQLIKLAKAFLSLEIELVS